MQSLRQLQRHADAIGQFIVVAFEHLFEQRLGARAIAAVELQKTELRGREQVVGRRLVEELETARSASVLLAHLREADRRIRAAARGSSGSSSRAFSNS